jgi:hypothetical protein
MNLETMNTGSEYLRLNTTNIVLLNPQFTLSWLC